MPLGHLGINVSDLDRSRRYYADILPLLGFEPFLDNAEEFAWRPSGGRPGTYLFFYPARHTYEPEGAGLQHLAFMVKSRAHVEAAVDRAESLGCEIVHRPQEWPQYPPPYYAAFWRDPDGIMLEAVCHHDR